MKIVFHTQNNMPSTVEKASSIKARSEGIESLFQYLIAEKKESCGSRAQMLLFPVQLTKGL
jgi:hypothetical protein